MTTQRTATEHGCRCWIPVIATMLILLGLFDSGLSLVMGGLATELDSLREQVEDAPPTSASSSTDFRRSRERRKFAED